MNLEGVFTAFCAWFLFKENFDRRIFLGMLFIITGGMVLSWSGSPKFDDWLGPILIMGACLTWGVDNNLTKKIPDGDALFIAMSKGMVAGVTNTALAFVFDSTLPSGLFLLRASGVGFFGYGVSLLCFVISLRHIAASRTGAYFSPVPFIGALIPIISGFEPLNWKLTASAFLIGVGMWLHLTEHHSHEHIHEAIEHEHEHTHDEHHKHQHEIVPRSHSHRHQHERLVHSHEHFPDTMHSHDH